MTLSYVCQCGTSQVDAPKQGVSKILSHGRGNTSSPVDFLGLCPRAAVRAEGQRPGWGPEGASSALGLLRLWEGGDCGPACSWWQHGPHLLFMPSPAPGSSPPALSPQAGSAGRPRAGPRTWSRVKAWPLPCMLSLPAFPGVPFQALGVVSLWEHGREGEAGHMGAAAAVWYSHYQGAVRPSPASPLATGAAFTPPLCLLTQGHLPQGRRCQLGNEGVLGPPKQSGSRSSQKPQKALLGVGAGGCRSPPWEAQGRSRACAPGMGREKEGEWGRTGAPSLPAQRMSPLLALGAGVCKALPGRVPSVSGRPSDAATRARSP